MEPEFLSPARRHLRACLHGKTNLSEIKHPWRKDWEFAVLHSLRVEALSVKILARQAHPLSEREVALLRLAAILHDLGRLESVERNGHAGVGAEMAGEWLAAHPELGLNPTEQERVVDMIAEHSNKGQPDPDLCRAVLKDADTLDEIGAISIFMTANVVDRRSPFFFHRLLQRLEEAELPYCDQKLAILNTQGAREILLERKAFIEDFIRQLRDELEEDPQAEAELCG